MSNFDEKVVDRIKRLEREVERLKVKESPIMSNYLLTTGKAADSDKLDGVDSTGFATAGHDHNAAYLGITAKAADSDKLDGIDSSSFGRPVFLTTPLTSTDWDGDSISTQATGVLIDLSTTHGVPAGVKAVMVRCYTRDSASATTNNLYFALSSGSTGYPQFAIRCSGLPNDYLTDVCGIVPCNADGDIYYRSAASGTGTMDVWIVITGYWL